ncbi:UNVERIFIED_CONTAM: hypothetical protein GTU68_013544 [Idotea baltica]|nr:hypothetical protein [Idotea baltica]
MSQQFNINGIPSQYGRVAIITGANAGLGFESALALAQKDMTVVLACRNLQRAEKAKDAILKVMPEADLDVLQIDLSSLKSVRNFAEQFLSKYKKLDVLMNNAGVMIPPFFKTEDGFELQMAANYFGHFLLTGLLLETILNTPNSRVVSLSSKAHEQGEINFDNLNSERSYSKFGAYAQSKLACLMFAYELDKRLKLKTGHSTSSVAAHPGASDTELSRHLPQWLYKIMRPLALATLVQNQKQGAEPQIMAALAEEVKGGDYFGPNGFQELRGRAVKVDSKPHAKHEDIWLRLWEASEVLTNIKYLNN